ncbi:MAG: hypothetical protein Tsb0020_30790 [Haliangiales bacterium]
MYTLWLRAVFGGLLIVAAVSGCRAEVAGGRDDGAAIFREVCARCHGADGAPPESMAKTLGVRDLSAAEFQSGVSDEVLRARIRDGSESRRMPAFEGVLTDSQIDAVAAYVRTLAKP